MRALVPLTWLGLLSIGTSAVFAGVGDPLDSRAYAKKHQFAESVTHHGNFDSTRFSSARQNIVVHTDSNGKVFAMTWNCKGLPANFEEVLGSVYANYVKEAIAQAQQAVADGNGPRGAHFLRFQSAHVWGEIGGRMGNLHGEINTDQTPPGVDIHEN